MIVSQVVLGDSHCDLPDLVAQQDRLLWEV